MPQRDPGVYLEDIEHYAAAATRFIEGCSLEQYLADEKTRAAVERVLEICGEAMNGLCKAARRSRRRFRIPGTLSASGTYWRTATRKLTTTRFMTLRSGTLPVCLLRSEMH